MNVIKLFIGTVLIVGACTTAPDGRKIVDAEKVKNYALLACLIAPTSAQIIQLYTDNKNIETTEQAVEILCKAAAPVIVQEKK